MSLGGLQYPVKALLQSGVFEGKTTAEELATLEHPLSDKELCVAAAFLEEEEIIEEEDEDRPGEDALAAELAPIQKQLKEFEKEYEKAKQKAKQKTKPRFEERQAMPGGADGVGLA